MREVKTGSQFRKDLKRYRNDKTKLEKLYDIVGYLERCEDVPSILQYHKAFQVWFYHSCTVSGLSGTDYQS